MLRDAVDFARDLAGYLQAISTRRRMRRQPEGLDLSGDELRASAWEAISRLHPERMRLRIIEVIAETATTTTLRCERVDGELPPFRPGQYVNVFTTVDGVRTSRPYSISSRPGQQHLDLTIKVGPQGFVAPHLARELHAGDELITTGPAGRFYYEPLIHGRDLVFIAAGSGITPFMSMIRDMAARKEPTPPKVNLIYGSRINDAIFHRELESLAARSSWLEVSFVFSNAPESWEGHAGRIDGDLISRLVGDVSQKMFSICGPAGLYHASQAALAALGVEQHRILRESFGGPADITGEESWPTEIKGEDTFEVTIEHHGTITVRANETLLNSLERHHLSLPASCRSGQCSSCRVRVIDGPTFTLNGSGLRRTDQQQSYAHACVTYPVGDLQVIL
jgi:glycine betaine catabolism B